MIKCVFRSALILVALLAIATPSTVAAQVEFIADISNAGNSSPRGMIEWNGKMYFAAGDGVNFRGLFSFDGTDVVTEALNMRNPAGFTPYQGNLYFMAQTLEHGYEFWRFDGVSAELVENISPGSGNSFPAPYVHFQGKLLFRASPNDSDTELYSYDGVKVVQETNTDGIAETRYIAYGDEVVVSYFMPDVSTEPHRFDGSSLTLIEDINPAGPSNPVAFTEYDGKIYFGADDGAGYELWCYDGLSAVKVTNGAPGFPRDAIVFDGKLYIGGPDELWSYDGVTHQVEAPLPNAEMGEMVVFGDRLYFGANYQSFGIELLSWDGTRIELVADINQTGTSPWFGDSSPEGFGTYMGGLYFGASDGNRKYGGHELYRLVAPSGEARVPVTGDGLVDFGEGTSLDIDFGGVVRIGGGGSARGATDVYVRRFHGSPLWVENVSHAIIAPDYWRIESDITFDNTTEFRVNLSEIPDHTLGDPEQLVIYSRPVVADGNFFERTTTYEPGSGELVATGYTQLGEFIIAGDSITPVLWLDLDAVIDGQSIRIAWRTSLGAQGGQFVVERSTDRLEFQSLLEVDEDSGPGGRYVAIDETPPWHREFAFYRIRFEQPDGESFSPAVRVALGPGTPSVLTTRPNPFSSFATITYQLADDGPVSLRVYDAAGRLLGTLFDGHGDAGQHQHLLDGRSFSSGVYYYVLESGNGRWTKKAIVSQ